MGKVTFAGGKVGMNVPSRLPSGYTELTYIESTGTQYIDTEFKSNQDTRVVMDVEITGANESLAANDMFGCRTSTYSKAYAVQWSMTNKCFQHFYNDGLDGLNFGDFTRQIIEMNKNVLSLNGITHERTYAAFQCDYSMYLFALNNAGTATFFSKMRVYSCQIYNNGTLIRDFIPCINANGEVGLYDTVNKKFYGNKGTGVFTYENAPITGILASDLAVGSTVYLNENGSPVEYLVVHNGLPSSMYDASCDGTWLLRKDIRENRAWYSTSNMFDYSQSTINTYLNGTFFNRFGSVEQEAIKQVKIPYRVGSTGSTMGNISAKVFLLSASELNSNELSVKDGITLSYFVGTAASGVEPKRVAYLNGTATYWLTRSAVQKSSTEFCAIYMLYPTGSIGASANSQESYGIRPTLILPKTSLFDESTLVLKGVS